MTTSTQVSQLLAKLVRIAAGEGSDPLSGTFLGTVTAVTATQVTVLPDSSADGTAIGPISVVGCALPAVSDQVLCMVLGDGSKICLGTVGPAVSSGGGSGDMTKIGQIVLGADTSIMTWSSIPQTFRALKIIAQLRSSVALDHGQVAMLFNGDTGANYNTFLGSGVSSGLSWSTFDGEAFARTGQFPGASADAGDYSSTEITIPGYRSGNRKAWHSTNGAPMTDAASGHRFDLGSGVWKNTAAITSVSLKDRSGANIVAGSEAVLYGLN